jgi:hypothetical protein
MGRLARRDRDSPAHRIRHRCNEKRLGVPVGAVSLFPAFDCACFQSLAPINSDVWPCRCRCLLRFPRKK